MKNKIGIVGFGSFGQFIYKHLEDRFDIIVRDPYLPTHTKKEFNLKNSSFSAFKDVNIIILCIPVQHLEKMLIELSSKIPKNALVIDVSSVKVKPVELMLQHLPKSVEILGTHPLFGPQSGAESIIGMNIVLCPVRIDDKKFKHIALFLENEKELTVLIRTPEIHDKQMAYVQALTHFIGRAINEIDIPDIEQKTPTYQNLLDIKKYLGKDSMELFLTIERENPYSKEVIDEFFNELNRLRSLI